MKSLTILLLVFICVLISSCSFKTLESQEYVKYIESTKGQRTDSLETANFKLNLIHIPYSYFIARSLNEKSADKSEMKKELKKAKPTTLMNMEIETKDRNLFDLSTWDKKDQMRFYSIDIKKCIKAISVSGDTLDCINFMFESSAFFGKRAFFEFGFNQDQSKIKEVCFQFLPISEEIFKCKISNNQQKNQPTLKIK